MGSSGPSRLGTNDMSARSSGSSRQGTNSMSLNISQDKSHQHQAGDKRKLMKAMMMMMMMMIGYH